MIGRMGIERIKGKTFFASKNISSRSVKQVECNLVEHGAGTQKEKEKKKKVVFAAFLAPRFFPYPTHEFFVKLLGMT